MPGRPEDDWVRRARVDLDSAELLADHGGHADTICFLCQQAVEKMLKAWLVARGQAPPKVHDLLVLAARVALRPAWVEGARIDLAFLSGCYLASRYPTLDPEQRTREDAERALACARAALAEPPPCPCGERA